MRVRAFTKFTPMYVYLLMQSYMNLNVYVRLDMFSKLVLRRFGLCYLPRLENLECFVSRKGSLGRREHLDQFKEGAHAAQEVVVGPITRIGQCFLSWSHGDTIHRP